MMRKLLENSLNLEHFFDDVLAYSMSWESHLDVLRDLFRRVSKDNLTLKPSKCNIGCKEKDFFGNTMTDRGILPIKPNVENISKVSRPTTKAQLQSFMGMADFYRKYVKDFSSISACLTDLTKKGTTKQIKVDMCS